MDPAKVSFNSIINDPDYDINQLKPAKFLNKFGKIKLELNENAVFEQVKIAFVQIGEMQKKIDDNLDKLCRSGLSEINKVDLQNLSDQRNALIIELNSLIQVEKSLKGSRVMLELEKDGVSSYKLHNVVNKLQKIVKNIDILTIDNEKYPSFRSMIDELESEVKNCSNQDKLLILNKRLDLIENKLVQSKDPHVDRYMNDISRCKNDLFKKLFSKNQIKFYDNEISKITKKQNIDYHSLNKIIEIEIKIAKIESDKEKLQKLTNMKQAYNAINTALQKDITGKATLPKLEEHKNFLERALTCVPFIVKSKNDAINAFTTTQINMMAQKCNKIDDEIKKIKNKQKVDFNDILLVFDSKIIPKAKFYDKIGTLNLSKEETNLQNQILGIIDNISLLETNINLRINLLKKGNLSPQEINKNSNEILADLNLLSSQKESITDLGELLRGTRVMLSLKKEHGFSSSKFESLAKEIEYLTSSLGFVSKDYLDIRKSIQHITHLVNSTSDQNELLNLIDKLDLIIKFTNLSLTKEKDDLFNKIDNCKKNITDKLNDNNKITVFSTEIDKLFEGDPSFEIFDKICNLGLEIAMLEHDQGKINTINNVKKANDEIKNISNNMWNVKHLSLDKLLDLGKHIERVLKVFEYLPKFENDKFKQFYNNKYDEIIKYRNARQKEFGKKLNKDLNIDKYEIGTAFKQFIDLLENLFDIQGNKEEVVNKFTKMTRTEQIETANQAFEKAIENLDNNVLTDFDMYDLIGELVLTGLIKTIKPELFSPSIFEKFFDTSRARHLSKEQLFYFVDRETMDFKSEFKNQFKEDILLKEAKKYIK